MKRILLRFSEIKDYKKIHWRHLVQSVLIFSCFCTLDTAALENNTVWLISAASAVAAIGGFAVFWFVIKKRSFTQLGTSTKGLWNRFTGLFKKK